MNQRCKLFLLVISLFILHSCKKDEVAYFDNNEPPYYAKVPTVKIRNYVNRLFIDLIGREPTDLELDKEAEALKALDVSDASRLALINRLMSDSNFVVGDTSYTLAYHKRLYELGKIRFLDGVSEQTLIDQAAIFKSDAYSDSLSGDIPGYEENTEAFNKLNAVLSSRKSYQSGEISLAKQLEAFLNNSIYDLINMNSFNFVNACFNDLFFRFPTQSEFQVSFNIVEDNLPGIVFGKGAQTKTELVKALTESQECTQGVIIWNYITLLARNPSSGELSQEMLKYGVDKDLKAFQKRLLIKNEYANF